MSNLSLRRAMVHIEDNNVVDTLMALTYEDKDRGVAGSAAPVADKAASVLGAMSNLDDPPAMARIADNSMEAMGYDSA
jgi:hypothetical protein